MSWPEYFKGFCLSQPSIKKIEQTKQNDSLILKDQMNWSFAFKKQFCETILPRKYKGNEENDKSFAEEEIEDKQDTDDIDPIAHMIQNILSNSPQKDSDGQDLQQDSDLEQSRLHEDPIASLSFRDTMHMLGLQANTICRLLEVACE